MELCGVIAARGGRKIRNLRKNEEGTDQLHIITSYT